MDPPNQRPQILRLPGPCNGRYELPTRAEVDAAAVGPEYRQYLEEIINSRRQNATQEQIQSMGIGANPESIVRSILEAQAPSEPAQKPTFSGAHKVFSNTSSMGPKQPIQRGDGSNKDPSDVAHEKVSNFWFDTLSHTKAQSATYPHVGQSSDRAVSPEFLSLAVPRAMAIVNAVKAWQEKETLSSLKSDPVSTSGFNLFESLCTCPELIIEVCKHLKPKDIINLYSTSRNFHGIINDHMQSTVKTWAEHMAPGSVKIFSRDTYRDQFYIRDPAGRPVDSAYYDMSHITIPEKERQQVVNTEVRLVPGLKWLQMVYDREVRVRDIIATLARMGHRLPTGADRALKKIWLIMDISTSEARVRLFRSEDLITSPDLFVLHMIMVKLMLAFNDPIYGPESPALLELMLGQRSLSSLWALLRHKKYTKKRDIRQLKLTYDVEPTPEQRMMGEPVHGVPIHKMGRGHLEGWGIGNEHLLRPDELIFIESARRQFDFDEYIDKMMFYGHVDFESGAPSVPTLEEMYMSDDDLEESPNVEKNREVGVVTSKVYEECGNVHFERGMWTPRDIKKHYHWDTFSEQEKQAITREEKEDFSQTFDVEKWLFNFRYLEKHLTNLLESIKTKDGRYDTNILPAPSGRVSGRFDQNIFNEWGTPSGLSKALRNMPDLPFPYDPPMDYQPDLASETGISDQTHMLFALPGEEELIDDDDLDGLGDNDFNYEAELEYVDNLRQRLQDAQHRGGEDEGPGEDDYEDEEMMDIDEETDIDEYSDDGDSDDGAPQYPGQQPFAPQQQHQAIQHPILYRTLQVRGPQQQHTPNYPVGFEFRARGGQQQLGPPQWPPGFGPPTQGGQQPPAPLRYPLGFGPPAQLGQQQLGGPHWPPGFGHPTQGAQSQQQVPRGPQA